VPPVMRLRFISALIACLFAAQVLAESFLPGFEDLPLMDGLRVLEDRGHVFDSPGGRLVETHAAGRVESARLRAFYHETLTALGWHASEAGTYHRDGEKLTIEVTDGGSELVVRFKLTPR